MSDSKNEPGQEGWVAPGAGASVSHQESGPSTGQWWAGPIPAPTHPGMVPSYAAQNFRSYKPGIAPLRPLSLGDILTSSLALLKYNPKTTLGLSLIVQLVSIAVVAPIMLIFSDRFSTLSSAGSSLQSGMEIIAVYGALLLASIISSFAQILLMILLTQVSADAVLGIKTTMGQTWQKTKKRLLPCLGSMILISLVWSLGFLLMMTAGGFALYALKDSAPGLAITIVILILVILAVLVCGFWLWVKMIMFIPPVMVLEKQSMFAAFKRGSFLVSGQFWRIVGVYILATLASSVVTSFLAAPLQLISIFAIGNVQQSNMVLMLSISQMATLGASALSSIVIAPFLAAVTCLQYVDQRIRKEGLDMILLTQQNHSEQDPWIYIAQQAR